MTFVETAERAILGIPYDPKKKPENQLVVQAFSEIADEIDVIKATADEALATAQAEVLTYLAPVAALATTNLTLSGNQTIDGVVNPATIAVTGQTDPIQNGIYNLGTPWTRRSDADTGAEILKRKFLVLGGTVNANTTWQFSNNTAPLVGTNAITFVKVGASDSVSNAIKTEVENARGGQASVDARLDLTDAEILAARGGRASVTARLDEGDRDFFLRFRAAQYYNNTTGEPIASSIYRSTEFIPYKPGAVFRYTGQNGAVPIGSVNFWKADGTLLSSLGALGTKTNFPVSSSDPLAAFITSSASNASSPKLVGQEAVDSRDLRQVLSTVRKIDYFAESGTENEYVNAAGNFVASAGWRRTGFVPAIPDEVFYYTGTGGLETVIATVAMFDADAEFLGAVAIDSAAQQTDIAVRASHPDTAFVVATSTAAAAARHFYKAVLSSAESGGGDPVPVATGAIVYPAEMHTIQGEEQTLYVPCLFEDRRRDDGDLVVTIEPMSANIDGIIPKIITSDRELPIIGGKLATSSIISARSKQRGLNTKFQRAVTVKTALTTDLAALGSVNVMFGPADSLTEYAGMAHATIRAAAASGVTINPIGTVNSIERDEVLGANLQLTEGRAGRDFANYTFETGLYDGVGDPANKCDPFDDAFIPTYLAMDRIGMRDWNPFLRPSTGGDPAGRIFNGYIYDPAFYRARFTTLSLPIPDAVVINLGTNELQHGGLPANNGRVTRGLDTIVGQTRDAWPTTYIGLVCNPLPFHSLSEARWEQQMILYRLIQDYVNDNAADVDGGGNPYIFLINAGAHCSPEVTVEPDVESTDAVTGSTVVSTSSNLHFEYGVKEQVGLTVWSALACRLTGA